MISLDPDPVAITIENPYRFVKIHVTIENPYSDKIRIKHETEHSMVKRCPLTEIIAGN